MNLDYFLLFYYVCESHQRDVFSDHMQTYANEFVSRYARLSSILEIDLLLAQQATRQVNLY